MKKLLIFSLVLAGLLLASCEQTPDYLVENYGLAENHKIEVITAKQMKAIIDSDDTCVMLFGFPACPWCQSLMPVYDEVAKQFDINAYYIDLKDMRDNENSADKEYYEFLYNFAHDALDTSKDRINAPTLMAIKNGELVGYNLDTVEGHVMGDTGVLPELTTQQREELVSIVRNLFTSCTLE